VYRGPSRSPCIGYIYTHPFRVGGIQLLFSPLSFTDDNLEQLNMIYQCFFMASSISLPEICIGICVDEILIFKGKRCFKYFVLGRTLKK